MVTAYHDSIFADDNWMKATPFTKKKALTTVMQQIKVWNWAPFQMQKKKEISQIGSKLKTWSETERLNKDAPKLISETLKKLQSFLSIWNVTKTSRKIPPSLVNQKKKIIFEIKWREDGRKISIFSNRELFWRAVNGATVC